MSERIRTLLAQLSEAEADLRDAPTILRAENARADIATLRHSLWLAGYEFEEAA